MCRNGFLVHILDHWLLQSHCETRYSCHHPATCCENQTIRKSSLREGAFVHNQCAASIM